MAPKFEALWILFFTATTVSQIELASATCLPNHAQRPIGQSQAL